MLFPLGSPHSDVTNAFLGPLVAANPPDAMSEGIEIATAACEKLANINYQSHIVAEVTLAISTDSQWEQGSLEAGCMPRSDLVMARHIFWELQRIQPLTHVIVVGLSR